MFSMQRIIQIIEQGMPAIKTTNVVDQSVPTVTHQLPLECLNHSGPNLNQ